MTKVLHGDRIARQGKIRLGCSAVLFGPGQATVLLTRRTDNGMWCLPGGMVDPGETVVEACEREVFEETGLSVSVKRLTGVYSDPNQVIVYSDGGKNHVVVLNFEVELKSGELVLSEETEDVRFIPIGEALGMDLFHGHVQHVKDALQNQKEAYLR